MQDPLYGVSYYFFFALIHLLSLHVSNTLPLDGEYATNPLKFTKIAYLHNSRNNDVTWLRGIGFDNSCTMG